MDSLEQNLSCSMLDAPGETGTLPLDVSFSSTQYFLSSRYVQGTLLDSACGIRRQERLRSLDCGRRGVREVGVLKFTSFKLHHFADEDIETPSG